MFYRDTWAEINIDRLKENIKKIKAHTQKDFIAVIKANGYGLGDKMMAQAAIDAGSCYLAVSSLDEAIALRIKNIKAPILVLGYTASEYVKEAIEYNITLTATSLQWIEDLCKQSLDQLKIHIKIDTGMNRLGMKYEDEVIQGLTLLKETSCKIEGIFTHFSCSDHEDNFMCDLQMNRFKKIVHACDYPFKWIHCCNSDASMHYQDDFSNAVRCGIAMLGISQFETNLLPVFSLFCKLVHVKQCNENETLGYGATYLTQADEWIGTIPIGYADGWIRKNQGRISFINNHACEFIGRICMDQSMIRLPHEYPVGTIVQLIGDLIPLPQVAIELDTIAYEIVTVLSDRVAKIYIKNGEKISVINPRLDR